MPTTTRTLKVIASSDITDDCVMDYPPALYKRTSDEMIEYWHDENGQSSFSGTNYKGQCPYTKSFADISEETRYILEEFIIERAAEDGVDMGLVRPIINVDLSACKIA
jgi:hypothetical protein